MAEVIYKRGLSEKLEKVPIQDGQILVTTDTGEMYIDINIGKEEKRIKIGPIIKTSQLTNDGNNGESPFIDIEAVNEALNNYIPNNKQIEYTNNKVFSINENSEDTQYPSAKAVYEAIINWELGGSTSNRIPTKTSQLENDGGPKDNGVPYTTQSDVQDYVNTFVFSENIDYRGTCGENITWAIDEKTNTLYIYGSGEMNSYSEYDGNNIDYLSPWYPYRDRIKDVVINGKVTNIGSYAFQGCNSLTSITIPNSVTAIDMGAFLSCSGLTNITIPDGVASISPYAFMGCRGLKYVIIGDGVSLISYNAFQDCSNLTDIIIPKSVKTIGWDAFSNCEQLTDIYYKGTSLEWEQISISDDVGFTDNVRIHCGYNNYLDFIVAQGTDGDWTYEKWASGKSVCWCLKTYEPIADDIQLWSGTNQTYYYAIQSFDFPEGLFMPNKRPRMFVDIEEDSGECWHTRKIPESEDKYHNETGVIYCVYPAQPTTIGKINVSIEARGTWRDTPSNVATLQKIIVSNLQNMRVSEVQNR